MIFNARERSINARVKTRPDHEANLVDTVDKSNLSQRLRDIRGLVFQIVYGCGNLHPHVMAP